MSISYQISAIVQYNTNDLAFLRTNLSQCAKFSSDIIVTMCTHLFNGDTEDVNLVRKSKEIINSFENVRLIEIAYDPINKRRPTYYHNLSRFIGMSVAKNDWVFFLDSDEIVSDEFNDWFQDYKNTDLAFDFTAYWYFREVIFRAEQTESAGFLVRKKHCQNWNFDDQLERKQFYQRLYETGKLIHGSEKLILSRSGKIMMHHFSWVRTKTQMLNKVKNWGHLNDKDWVSLVEEEFSRPFNGTDFVHGYSYNVVNNNFNIRL